MRTARELDQLLHEAVEISAVPGVVAAVTTREGTIYQGAHGRSGTGGDIDFDSIFWIASMTKALTSVAAMQLVERGLLPLDEPIETVLPELSAPQILEGFDSRGMPYLRPARKKMTLAHLLSHSSGFGEDVWHADIARYLEVTGTPSGGTGKRAALDLPLLFEPGEGWQYGISHDWAGQAVERISGKRLDAYLSEHLFAPLGMTDTTYVLDEAQRARLVRVHRREADGQLTPFDRVTPAKREFISGGGTLYSKAADYLAFMRMLLNGGTLDGNSVLLPATVRALAENRTGDVPVSSLEPAYPAMSNRVTFLPATRKCWGLGFMVNLDDSPTGRRAGSLAWAGLGNTYFWVDPASGVAGLLMTQILPFADRPTLDLFAAFERTVYEAQIASHRSQ